MSCSPNGKFLVSLGSGGPGRVWDVASSTAIASLPKENVSILDSLIGEPFWINLLQSGRILDFVTLSIIQVFPWSTTRVLSGCRSVFLLTFISILCFLTKTSNCHHKDLVSWHSWNNQQKWNQQYSFLCTEKWKYLWFSVFFSLDCYSSCFVTCFWTNWICSTSRMRFLDSADFLKVMIIIRFCILLQFEVKI